MESSSPTLGKLKIFLGYAPGVGKTYAMLEAARQKKAQGLDVILGAIDSHNQAEVEAICAAFESLTPPANTAAILLPALLARRPAIILIDDLASPNPPGSLHPQRFQDVQDLLRAGIDVFTTLNLQNLSSLNDLVRQVTGYVEPNTIPDQLLEEANEIELVDLPPEDLIRRIHLRESDLPADALPAIDAFYRLGNLNALREMALRKTASKVDAQLLAYKEENEIKTTWPAAEKLLVCLSPSPSAIPLVRAAKRIAGELKAEWVAISVETPANIGMADERKMLHLQALQLAEELGAKVLTIQSGDSPAEMARAILQTAHSRNSTRVLLARSKPSSLWPIFRNTLHQEIIRQANDVDVMVIANPLNTNKSFTAPVFIRHSKASNYLQATLLTIIASVFINQFELSLSPTNLVMTYLLSVTLAALYLGRGPALLASTLSVLIFDFFFIPPYYTMEVADTEYLLTFLGFSIVSFVISTLVTQVREQARNAHDRESDTSLLYSLSRGLAGVTDIETICRLLEEHLRADFGSDILLYLPDGANLKAIQANPSQPPVGDAEVALAQWCFKNNEPAGAGTTTLSSSEPRFIPLSTSKHVLGVLSFKPNHPNTILSPSKKRILSLFADQTAQAIERITLAEQTRQFKLLQATEKLQNALLNSISHELRTPLVSITGTLSFLETEGKNLDTPTRQSMVETAREEADRLNRLVGNLLDMTRLEAGAINIKREPADVEDLLGTAVGQMEKRLTGRAIHINLPPSLPAITLDFVLIIHVLTNLLDNALKYSPANSPIELTAAADSRHITISVADAGSGIPVPDLERIFDKFYRSARTSKASGTGLGLAICKGIIEAHNGTIWAANRPQGGSIFSFTLPL